MALAATGIVIYDPLNGSNDNAGYFDASLASAGTDYPRTQAAAILTATDLACTTGGTTLTSATGGFTAAMVGNGIYIKSGTHFTVGLYVITARADTNTVTLDRDPTDGSNASGGEGAVGGRRAVLLDAFTEYCVAGMTLELWATAAMVLTESISLSVSGTAALPIVIDGRASDGTAYPQGANRPTITAGANTFVLNNYFTMRNVILTGSSASGATQANSFGIVETCKITNDSATADRPALYWYGDGVRVINCELISTNGPAFRNQGRGTLVFASYLHDSKYGVYLQYTFNTINQNIIEACSTAGIHYVGAQYGQTVLNNTIDTCVDGITHEYSVPYCSTFLNNILSNHTSEGAAWASLVLNNHWDYNDFYNNGTDRTNVAAGPNDNDVDPGYTDAAGGDFSTGANVADTGFGIRLGVG